MRPSTFLATLALLAAAALSITGCAGPHPMSPQHLYVGNDNASGQLLEFTLPLSNTSTPTVTVATTTGTVNLTSVAVDANGNVATGDNAGHVDLFAAPMTNSSTSAAAFNNGVATNDGQMIFTTAGDLFAATAGNNVNVFTHPLTSLSTPSQSITDISLTSAIGVALDSANNLYVTNAGSTGSTISVFASPYTSAPTVTPVVAAAYRKIAITSTQLFVCNVGLGTIGGIDVYTLPLTASSAPAFTISNVNGPEAVALDSQGNLYVGNVNDSTVRVFAPPFSASSTPTVTLNLGSSVSLFGLAVGK